MMDDVYTHIHRYTWVYNFGEMSGEINRRKWQLQSSESKKSVHGAGRNSRLKNSQLNSVPTVAHPMPIRIRRGRRKNSVQKPHFHIVYNRVNLNGTAIDESNNFDKSRDATKAIKLKYGLTFSPKKKLYEDAIAEMKPKIQAAMYRCKSWDEFRRRLAPAGITVEFYNDRDTGKPQGIRFSDGEFTFNGSKIDRAFSYKRLDKFFAKNAGIKEAEPQRPAPISVTGKVKESPVANVVENIIETGCQALGGLFQVGPGYDPDEEAFIRAMKRKPKKKKGRSL